MSYKQIKQYADLVHEASIYGGKEPFIRALGENSFQSGKRRGYVEGLAAGFVLGGAVTALIARAVYQKKRQESAGAEERVETNEAASVQEDEFSEWESEK